MKAHELKTFQVFTRISSQNIDPTSGHDVLSLPNEILLEIMSHSTPKTLYNLCLSSKVFNALAQPLLYQEYSYPDLEGAFWPFMRTVFARPDLASRVRELTLHECGWASCEASIETAWGKTQDDKMYERISDLWTGFRDPSPELEDADEYPSDYTLDSEA